MIDDQKLKPHAIADFLAAHGGPFFELQERMGLLQQNALRTRTRSLIFIGLAWGVPFLLCLLNDTLLNSSSGLPYLLDLGVWARFFVAIGAFTLSEQQIEQQLRLKLSRAFTAPIVEPSSVPDGARAINVALLRRNSRAAEVVLVCPH